MRWMERSGAERRLRGTRVSQRSRCRSSSSSSERQAPAPFAAESDCTFENEFGIRCRSLFVVQNLTKSTGYVVLTRVVAYEVSLTFINSI